MSLLRVNDLNVRFRTEDALVHAVNGVNFTLARGQTLGIVGESGSGKSQSVLAMMGLLANNGQASGEVCYQGKNLLTLSQAELNRVRGDRLSMIFQDPMTSLNPYLTIERQMSEVLALHKGLDRQTARLRAISLLDAVRIPDASRRISRYPHEFSGGMRQRVMIAMALLCEPEILIADEPTTALDVTVQAQILSLLRDLQRDFATAIIMITHDLGVVAGLCDQVIVMYGGRVMEHADAESVFYQPSHPYTIGLLGALPALDDQAGMLTSIPGNPPNLAALPAGCPFAERCSHALPTCSKQVPALLPVVPGGSALRACHAPVSQMHAVAREAAHV